MVFTWLGSLSAPDLIIEFSLLLLIIFTPLPKGTFIGWPVTVVHILSFIMLMSWIFKVIEHKSWNSIKTPVDYPVISFFILAIISSIFSVDHGKSLIGILKLLDCLIIFYIVANNIDTEEKVKVLIYSVILVGAFISIFGLIQFFGGIDRSWWVSKSELSATFENSNYFAGYLAMVILLAIGMLFNNMEISQRIIVSYFLIIMIAAFILSLSRGGLISLLMAIMVISVLFLSKFRVNKEELISIKWYSVIPFLLIIIFLLIFLGFSNISNKFSVTMNKDYRTLNGRIELWKNALRIIRDYPVIGAGIDVFTSFRSPIPPKYKNIDNDYMKNIKKILLSNYQGYDGMELCNEYIQIGSEMGTLGLLCFIWLIIKSIYRSIKLYNQKRDILKQNLCLGIIGGGIATVIHMFSANILNFMSNSVLLSILMGIIFGKYCKVNVATPVRFRHRDG